MRIAKTYGNLRKDLDQIETQLYSTINTKHPTLQKSAKQLLRAGGKRIRPVFVLVSSQLGKNFSKKDVISTAVTIELIHMATLVHDDVIDHASLRRGKPTVREQYNNRIAMYNGDYLLACALEVMTTIDNSKLHKLLADTIVQVCTGEIDQVKDKFDWNQKIRTYLRRIKRKTAILIACCCKLGGLLGGLSDKDAGHLYKYGYYVGMSYQVIDDVLDFTSTEKQLGKPVGNDLLQGNITYPVLVAMNDKDFNQDIISLFSTNHDITQIDLKDMIVRMHQLGAFKKSYDLSEKYLTKSLIEISKLPMNKAKDTLVDIANFIGQRRS